MIRQNDKRRKVFIHRSERVTHPAACGRESRAIKTGRLQERALRVNTGFSHQIVNPRNLVHHIAKRRDRLAEHLSGLPIRLKIPHRLEPRSEPVLKRLHMFAKITRLPVMLHKFRFEIEQVQMARGTRHKKLHHALRLRRMMQHAGARLTANQRSERNPPQPATALPKEIATVHRSARADSVKRRVVHSMVNNPQPRRKVVTRLRE